MPLFLQHKPISILIGYVLFPFIIFAQPIGQLKVEPGGKFFTTSDGTPFWWMEGELNQASGYNTLDSFERLRELVSNGISVITYKIPGSSIKEITSGKYPEKSSEPGLNELDTLIIRAQKLNLKINILIDLEQISRIDTLQTKEQYVASLANYLGRRYHSNKGLAWSVEFPGNKGQLKKNLVLIRTFANALNEKAGDHLISLTPPPNHSSDQWVHHDQWLDYNTVCTRSDFYPLTKARNQMPAKPVVCVTDKSADAIHKTCIHSILNGACGLRIKEPEPDGKFTNSWFLNYYLQMDWWKLIPDRSLLLNVTNQGDLQKTVARMPDYSKLIVYFPDNTPATIDLTQMPGKKIKVSWYDPLTGEKSKGTKQSTSVLKFRPPLGWPEAILILEP